jgi:D-alanyl-lipoteichoic acid acyltransferase DltB (MBOAT superfamily)
LFTSLQYYAALIIALGLFYTCPTRARIYYLLAISCLFYLVMAPVWFALLVGEIVIAYCVGGTLSRAETDRARNLLLFCGLIPIVGALLVLKLAGALQGLLMPLGVSYFTFKLISYLLEVYWDETQVASDFVEFATFASFAPQIVSGPIQRSRQFLRQVPRLRDGTFDPEQFEAGFFTILRGLLLKLLIADRLGAFISLVDAAPQAYRRSVLLTVVLCYTVQLYADFAGYTLIAIGIGRVFGIESPPNFNAPFSSTNIQMFWRRWHITLSSWVADYVFTPLSLSLRRAGRLGMVVSLTVSMILIGLWHGLSYTFFAFGALQGLYISVSALTMPGRERLLTRLAARPTVHLGISLHVKTVTLSVLTQPSEQRELSRIDVFTPLSAAFVYAMVSFSMIFWQAPSLDAAILHLRLLARTIPTGPLGFADIRTDVVDPVFACMVIAFWHGAGAPGFAWVAEHVGSRVPRWVIGGLALLLICALSTEEGSSFIYGQF